METPRFVVLSISIKKEGDKWTAICRELGTAAFAYTFEEANKHILEAIKIIG